MVKTRGRCPSHLKSAMQASVRKESPLTRECRLSAAGLSSPAACVHSGHAAPLPRNGEQSARSGVELATYSIKGQPREPGNLT
ncbi:uncharacterized protein STAUR_2510 [Stigmatella aurantiaca DW4/3-1]|uniref:Uncharacterized protein n=1 Tax=Stigmatella aurantiaca (strain DW4/3-1) TaxID=378806 RepID=E3FHP2_STIAD|nr:uncharacterized protein STAUR_2510 [Stigmatella aurantiaca DW4/3-1]